MNQTLEVIKSRRSIRAYGEEQISEHALQEIIEAGLFAPNGNNKQSWHFTVIQDKKVLRELNYETKGVLARSENPFLRRVGNNEELDIFNGAPTVIVVSGEEEDENSIINCSMASENMLLAAQSLHIASCYIISPRYLFEGDERAYFEEKIGIPEGYKVYNAVLLGFRQDDADPEPVPRKEGCVSYIR